MAITLPGNSPLKLGSSPSNAGYTDTFGTFHPYTSTGQLTANANQITDAFGNTHAANSGFGGAATAQQQSNTVAANAADPGYAKFGLTAPSTSASATNAFGGTNPDYANQVTTPEGQLSAYNSFLTSNPNALYGSANAASNTSVAGYYNGNQQDPYLYNTTVGGKNYLYAPTSWTGTEGGSSLNNNAALSALGGQAYAMPGGGAGGKYSGTGYLFDPTFDQSKLQGAYSYTPGESGGQGLKELAQVASVVAPMIIGPAAGALFGAAGGAGGAIAGAGGQGALEAIAPSLLSSGTGSLVGSGVGGLIGGGADAAAAAGFGGIASGASAAASGATGGLDQAPSAGIQDQAANFAANQGVGINGAASGAPGNASVSSSLGQNMLNTPAGTGTIDELGSAPAAADATSAAPSAASNASPTSFGGAAPSDAQLLNASVPYTGPDPLADTGYLSNLDTSAVAPGADASAGGATGGINAAGTAGGGSGGILGTIQKILGAGAATKALTGAVSGSGGSNVAGGTAAAGAGTNPLAGIISGGLGLLNPAKGFAYSGPAVPDANNAAMIQANQQGAQGVMNTFNALNQPNFTMDTSNLDTQLRNQGIYPTPSFDSTKPIGPNNQPGAYEQAMMRLKTSQNQLTAANEGEAGALGLTAASNLFKNQVSANQTAFPEAEALWNAKAGATTAQNQNIGNVLGPLLGYGLQIPQGQTSGTNFDSWLNSLFG